MSRKVYLRWNDLEVSVPPKPPSLFDRLKSLVPGRGVGDSGAGGSPLAPEPRQILKSVNGVARPGDLIALMGSSGAGKTTLLNTLSRRNQGSLTVAGEILVNEQVCKHIGSVSAYVQQEDLFLVTLTVREHLQFQAVLRMGMEFTTEKRYERVEEVIHELGLQSCANAQIGNNRTVQGISGGERKRLAFASEILEDPPLLFADEPTSGLDSFKATSVIQALQSMAAKGRTIICTIHQPPSEVFSMFNRLMLLAEGRVAYLGDMSRAISYFGTLGFVCPDHFNPADFFVFTLAIVPGEEDACREKVKKINDAYKAMEVELREADHMTTATTPAAPHKKTEAEEEGIGAAPRLMLTALKEPGDTADDGRSVQNEVELRSLNNEPQATDAAAEEAEATLDDNPLAMAELDPADLESGDAELKRPLSHSVSMEINQSKAPVESIWTQGRWLAWRSWVTTIREPLIVKVRVIQAIFFGLLCGLIFLRLKHDSMRVQNVAGALFFIVLQNVFGTIFPTVQTLPVEVPVFLREHSNRMYRSTIYILTKSLAGLPFNIVLPFIFTTIAYWMIGLNEEVSRYFSACGIIILTTMAAESYGYFISALSQNEQVALSLTSPFVIPFMLFGGLLLNAESTPVYFIWLERISFIKYSFHAIMTNEFHNAPNPACMTSMLANTTTTGRMCFTDGNAVLNFYGINASEFSLNLGLLFALGVCWRILATIVFVFKVRKN